MIASFEVSLHVADYESFDACKAATDDALGHAKHELAVCAGVESLPTTIDWEIKFLEFDSNNPTHAGAYFLATFNDNR